MSSAKPALVKAIRLAIGGAMGVSAGLAGPLAQAQEKVEEIYVTGSRIARTSDFENPSPIVAFDRDELEKSGYANLQQLLEKQSFSGNGTFSTRGNNQDSTANGTASISLRGMGADATLVLVNGRRVAISAFAESITTNFVDINTIPAAAIERVEVLKDGASALYGSDAVAGVVNIVLRKDFEGAEISTGYGGADGYDEFRASGIFGVNGGENDENNLTVILDYFKNSTLENKERGHLGSADQSARGGPASDQRSTRSFPGSFYLNGSATSVADPACPPDRNFGSLCVFDYGPFNLLTPEAERTGLMLLGHMAFGAGVEGFTEVGVQHNNSIAQGAPAPYDEGAGLTVPVTNPGNPFPGATSIALGRFRTVDAGARRWDITTDNLRLVLGLRGSFTDWDWEVSAQRGRGESEQSGDKSMGWVRTDLLQNEINAGRYNPFGGTVNPQSVINAITTNVVRRGNSDLTSYDASLTGALFDMPAGKLQMAAGIEYREESISDTPDEQFQEGLIFGTEAVSAAADRDIKSAYVEFSVPLLQSLELSIAGRYDDYSDFGDTTNPKVAVRWEPIESLAFRGSWGTGFRAPSLAQVGLGPSADSLRFTDTYSCEDRGIDPADCLPLDYTVIFSGNPDLDPEESENYNFGIAWRPSSSFEISADYWNIKQKHKIDRVPALYLYNQFCDVQDSTVCTRGTPGTGATLGPLISLNSSFINIGEQHVDGIDLNTTYSADVGAGLLSLNLDYSHLLKFERVALGSEGTSLETTDLAGKYEYPEDRAVLTGDWSTEAWGLTAAVHYISSFDDLNTTLDYSASTRSVASFTTVTLQGRYTGFKGLTIALGIDNVLDEDVPFAIGDGDTDVYGYVQSQHDPRGLFAYGQLTYKFGGQ